MPDIAERAPARELALFEAYLVICYGIVAMIGGYVLGRAFGWHAFGFHLDGMVIRTSQEVVPREAICWAVYNLVAYAVVSFAVFRRRYTTEELSLHPSNRRADLITILTLLVIESTGQLSLARESILDVSAHQAMLGGPLTFVIGLAGTVMPTMVKVFAIGQAALATSACASRGHAAGCGSACRRIRTFRAACAPRSGCSWPQAAPT